MPFLQPLQHVQITCRRNFDCYLDIGLLLSLVRLVVCWNCHVTGFARSTRVVCEFHTPFNGDKLTVLQKAKLVWRLMNICTELLQNYYFKCFRCSTACVTDRFLESLFAYGYTAHNNMKFSFAFRKRSYLRVSCVLFVCVNKKDKTRRYI